MSLPFNYKLFGLEPRDLAVYEAMLKNPEAASIRTIAEAVSLNRGTTFEIIKKLVGLGLVGSQFKNKRKVYVAQPPANLQKYASDISENVVQELPKLEDYIQTLQKTSLVEASSQFTQFYEGEDEIAALLRDVLNTSSKLKPKEYQALSSAEIRGLLYGKFRNFTHQRIKLGIFTRVIAIGEGGGAVKLAERRWLAAEKAPACYVLIYGNKVALISLSEAGNVQGVVVQNAGVAQLQRLAFERLWQTLG